MRWTQHVERRTTMLRTAKPRGPDISTPISSLRRDDVADDGDKKARSPGRAWSKPLKPAARGMPGVSGEARGDYTRTLFFFACEAAGALKRPAFPAPSVFEGKVLASLGRNSVAGTWKCVFTSVSDPGSFASFRDASKRRAMVRNCAPENLETPGLVLTHHPGMTVGSE